MNNELNKYELAVKTETAFEWRKWSKLIPYINWPSEWEVKAIPPFAMAVIRYKVRLKDNPEINVSIYLDCYDLLGFCGKPYWEIYPHKEDTYRCGMQQVDGLLRGITESFEDQLENNDER